MERHNSTGSVSFLARLSLAFRVLVDAALAAQLKALTTGHPSAQNKAASPKAPARPAVPERVHASGLLTLSALQREGRLIDFLQQDIAGFSDEEVGAAARVVHAGCAKVLKQYFVLEPAVGQAEGSTMTIAPGFDAQRIRLTGNVAGQPPFKGIVKHHGWVAKEVRLPELAENLDPRAIAPAEVELP